MVIRYNMGWYEMLLIDVPLFFAATASVANFYMVCQREIHPRLARAAPLPAVPHVDRDRAGGQQHPRRLRGPVQQAERVHPHAQVPHRGRADDWVGKKYRQVDGVQPLIELALGLYFTVTVFYALANGIYGTLPFLVLFQVGFLYTGLLSVVQQFADDAVALKTQVAGGEYGFRARFPPAATPNRGGA